MIKILNFHVVYKRRKFKIYKFFLCEILLYMILEYALII